MACQRAADEVHDQPQCEQDNNDAYQLSHIKEVRDTRGEVRAGSKGEKRGLPVFFRTSYLVP